MCDGSSFGVLAAGYNGINHYRGEQVQPLNRDRWKPVTGAVSKTPFLLFPSLPNEESSCAPPFSPSFSSLRMRLTRVRVTTFVSSNRLDGEQVQRVERKAGLLSLEFLFLNRV